MKLLNPLLESLLHLLHTDAFDKNLNIWKKEKENVLRNNNSNKIIRIKVKNKLKYNTAYINM